MTDPLLMLKNSAFIWSLLFHGPLSLCLDLGASPGSQPKAPRLAPDSYLSALAPNLYCPQFIFNSPGQKFATTTTAACIANTNTTTTNNSNIK